MVTVLFKYLELLHGVTGMGVLMWWVERHGDLGFINVLNCDLVRSFGTSRHVHVGEKDMTEEQESVQIEQSHPYP